jgi:hypothetical protein
MTEIKHGTGTLSAERSWSPIVELRQYTLHPGQRDVLVNLFDREFVESQEMLDIKVIGQFRDLGDPNRFVWLRGFSNMTERQQSLKDFYGGPAWAAHREVAKATMADTDNVLLLRPARANSGFAATSRGRKPRHCPGDGPGVVVATVYSLDTPAENGFVDYFEAALKPALLASEVAVLAYFVSEHTENTFPALPVREAENVFVWFAGFANHYRGQAIDLDSGAIGRTVRQAPNLTRVPETLRLKPTARSRLDGTSSPSPAALAQSTRRDVVR